MRVIEKQKDSISSLPARKISGVQLKVMSSQLAQRILKELVKKPNYPMALAKRLKINEQKIYYHIRNLERARIIEVSHQETVHGTVANFYSVTAPSFVVALSEFRQSHKIPGIQAPPVDFLSPIIENGVLDGTFVVGSPDPHGSEMARSRDGYYGIDLALFLGTFINNVSGLNVKLDTEVRNDDLQKNLIVIGGPVVNVVMAKINRFLPVKFDQKKGWAVTSSISGKTYHEDSCGIVAKVKNPFNKKKWVLVVAGKRYAGTQAVTIAFLNHFNELVKGNKYDNKISARVIEGLDRNADGVVDDVRFVE